MARDPYYIYLVLPPGEDFRVERLLYETEGSMKPVAHCTEPPMIGTENNVLKIEPLDGHPTRKLSLILDRVHPELKLSIRVSDKPTPDWEVLSEGLRSAEHDAGRSLAIDDLEDYLRFSRNNENVLALLASLHRKEKNHETAESYALRSLLINPEDLAFNEYGEIQKERPPRETSEIRELQQGASGWSLDAHHGLVVAEREQDYLLDRNGWHVSRFREVLEVRRPAMARLLRSLSFNFTAGKDYLLHTHLRVIHGNDEVETVSSENLSVFDSTDKNVFIRVEEEKTAQWILPDLEAGDMIEWSYHLLTRDHHPEEEIEFFILASVFNPGFPTYRGSCRFDAPADLPVRVVSRNGNLERAEAPREDDRKVITVRGDTYIPARNSGFHFENNYLNPIAACSYEKTTWPEVAARGRLHNIGDGNQEDSLPEPLKKILEEGGTPEEALERVFYWVRDKLKYAAFHSSNEQVGKAARAAQIVEAGTGDCKDKSYLLALACRELGLDHEYLVISSRTGILLEDVPAPQFDHIFLRARTPGGWRYMDGANSASPFGSPPAWCQGMKAMAVDDSGTILTLPVDPPEANGIRVQEIFSVLADGWLDGTFDFEARGHSGRLANERWKTVSLSMSDEKLAVQESLGAYLPYTQVRGHERLSDTGASGTFRVSGDHRRAYFVPLDHKGTLLGRLVWNIPTLPLGYWRNLEARRLFVVDFPVQLEVEARLQGDLLGRVGDFSRVANLDNGIVRIREEIEESASGLTIRRSIAFDEKFVEEAQIPRWRESMEAIERALTLVVSLEGKPGGRD